MQDCSSGSLQAKETDASLPKRNLRYLVKKEEQAAYI